MKRNKLTGIPAGKVNSSSPKSCESGFCVRAGMHQRNEHAYHASGMVRLSAEPEMETAEDALDIPEMLEMMIPEGAKESMEAVEISADEEVFEAVDEDGSETEYAETLNSVDYSRERIPVLDPVCGGVACEPHELIYDQGDGKVCPIPDPLGVLTEDGLHPFFPEVRNPSSNVAAI